MCHWFSQSPYPIIIYSVANYRPHLSHFWGNSCDFRDPNLVTFYFYLWIDPFLDWMKNTLLFICSTNILVRLLTVNMKNCLTPKNPKMCDPILVTLLKMRPHYSQSSRENATPSGGTSPLASYKEVTPPPPQPPGGVHRLRNTWSSPLSQLVDNDVPSSFTAMSSHATNVWLRLSPPQRLPPAISQ